jgi:hypothetical protein
MRNQNNNLQHFFDLSVGQYLKIDHSFFRNKSNTFQKAAGDSFTTNLICLWSEALPKQHELRIFDIRNDKSTGNR